MISPNPCKLFVFCILTTQLRARSRTMPERKQDEKRHGNQTGSLPTGLVPRKDRIYGFICRTCRRFGTVHESVSDS